MSAAGSPRTRWRRIVAITVAAVLAMGLGQVASGVPGGEQDGAQDPVTKSLRSTCDFPVAGAQQHVLATITATFPVSAPAGAGVAATDITASLVLPEPAVAALRAAGARSVEGIAYLELAVAYPAGPGTAPVRLEITAQPLPDAGELLVEGPGAMDPVPAADPGELVFALGAPRLALVLRTEDGGLITDESVAVVPCTPEPDQDTALATVRVTEPDEAGTSTQPPPRTTGPTTAPGGPATDPGGSPDSPGEPGQAPPATAEEEPGPCGDVIPPDAAKSLNGYYDVVVKTIVKKLGSEITFGPPGYLGGQVWIWRRPRPGGGRPLFCNGIQGALALPAMRGSFVIFRFVPTTALVNVIPVGVAEGVVDPITFRFTGRAVTNMTLSDVRVGGTPLDVGPNCQTETPITIDLQAEQKDWNLANGGVMAAEFTIPEFSGCGVVEPLDSLFTNLVSGPGNQIRIDFGPIRQCSQANPPPPVCAPAGGG